MREIRFRAWDKKAKCFYYFSLKELWAEGCEAQLSELNDPKHLALNTDYPYEEEEQYTDKKDRDGEEIYQGDLLEYSMEGIKQTPPYMVEDTRWFYLDIHTLDNYMRIEEKSLKIIGNIHENPELLEARV